MGEIIRDASIVRPVYHVRDRDGETAIVALYFDDAAKWTRDKRVKLGTTICVMYAEQKVFMDGQQGIRCEDSEHIQGIIIFSLLTLVLPCSLSTLMAISAAVASDGSNCKTCGKPANNSCARCKTKYCSKVIFFTALLIYRNVKQGIGRLINVSVPSSRLSESGNQWTGIDQLLSKACM